MTPLTPAALERIRTLAMAATPGEWRFYPGSRAIVAKRIDERFEISVASVSRGDQRTKEPFSMEANGQFIAAVSPSVVLALVEEVERLRKELGE